MNAAELKGPLDGLPEAVLAGLETPCFVFDPGIVEQDYNELKAALDTQLVVSLKANPVVDLLVRSVHAFTDGIEIASAGELNLTVGRIGVPRYVNTPALDDNLAESAIACRATIVADSPMQVETILAAAKRRPTPLRLALRVSARAVAGADGVAVAADHFGMDVDDVLKTLDRLAETSLKVCGLHTFAGSDRFARAAVPVARGMAQLLRTVKGHPAANIEFVNLGGGFPVEWRDMHFDFSSYRILLEDLFHGVAVLHEAGRALFARCGKFVTKVVSVKSLDGVWYAVCDGGMAHCFLLCQTEKVVKDWRQPSVIRREGASGEHSGTTVIVGNTCNRADVIGRLGGAPPQVGDLLVYSDCGAYHTYTPRGFLSLRAPVHYIAA